MNHCTTATRIIYRSSPSLSHTLYVTNAHLQKEPTAKLSSFMEPLKCCPVALASQSVSSFRDTHRSRLATSHGTQPRHPSAVVVLRPARVGFSVSSTMERRTRMCGRFVAFYPKTCRTSFAKSPRNGKGGRGRGVKCVCRTWE